MWVTPCRQIHSTLSYIPLQPHYNPTPYNAGTSLYSSWYLWWFMYPYLRTADVILKKNLLSQTNAFYYWMESTQWSMVFINHTIYPLWTRAIWNFYLVICLSLLRITKHYILFFFVGQTSLSFGNIVLQQKKILCNLWTKTCNKSNEKWVCLNFFFTVSKKTYNLFQKLSHLKWL